MHLLIAPALLSLPLCTAADTSAEYPSWGAPTLVEHPIASGAVPLYLDGDGWTATNAHEKQPKPPLAATVPGDIITDLQRAGRVQDPYWNVTWRDPAFVSAWNDGVWTYERRFPTQPPMSTGETLLVLDGIRMGATVSLNGHFLANITDQFLRYELPVAQQLLGVGQENALRIAFEKDIATGGRSTYSNQIDWAPNFVTFDPTAQQVADAQRIVGRQTFGFGIVRRALCAAVLLLSAASPTAAGSKSAHDRCRCARCAVEVRLPAPCAAEERRAEAARPTHFLRRSPSHLHSQRRQSRGAPYTHLLLLGFFPIEI